MRSIRSVGYMLLVWLLLAGCVGTSTSARQEVRSVAVRYLQAIARGEGQVACALLSSRGLADGGYRSRAACVRAYTHAPSHEHFRIVRIMLHRAHTAWVVIRGSDSGTIELRRYGHRWLIDVG